MYEWLFGILPILLKLSGPAALCIIGGATLFNSFQTARLRNEVCELKYECLRLRSQVNTFHDKGARIKIKRSPAIDIPPKPTFSLEDIEIID